MITPAHLPELERLLVAIVEAEDDFDAACQSRDHDAADAASDALTHVRDELSALARRVAAEPTPAAVGMEEIDDALLTVEMASENVALDNGRATIRRRDEAHDELLMLVRAALAARDERIAALERTESILRSVADSRSDGGIEEIVGRVDADLARRAAEWERMADEVAAANVEATARIAALEAGLREACDIAAIHNVPGRNDYDPADDANTDRLRALADDEQAARDRLAAMGIDADAEYQRFRTALGGFPVESDGWPDPDARCRCGHILGFHAADPPHRCGATGCTCTARALADAGKVGA